METQPRKARFSHLIGLSILQKVLTFLLNMVVLRVVRVQVAGLATIRMEFLLSCILFPREAFRLAFLRYNPFSKDHVQRQDVERFMNTAWLNVPLSVALTGIVLLCFSHSDERSNSIAHYYTLTLYLYCLAAILESVSEPLFLLAYTNLEFSMRIKAESWAFSMRGLVLCVLLVYFNAGLLSYGIAQLVYALVLIFHYSYSYRTFIKAPADSASNTLTSLTSFHDLLPSKPSTGPIFSTDVFSLSTPLVVQAIVKFGLTEGDKLVLSVFESAYSMGVYSVAFNLGSLAPRILFQPVEETSRAVFSKLRLKDCTGSKSAKDMEVLRESYTMCCSLIKFMVLVGCIFAVFGSQFTITLVNVLLGTAKAQTEVPLVLSYYCLYVGLLAVNGVAEAFVYATGDSHQLMELNYFLIGCFGAYGSIAAFSVSYAALGWRGLLLANSFNMALRICYCVYFMRRYYAVIIKSTTRSLVSQLLPSSATLLWLACSYVVLHCSHVALFHQSVWSYPFGESHDLLLPSLRTHGIHIGVGSLLFIVLVALLYVKEATYLRELLTFKTKKL